MEDVDNFTFLTYMQAISRLASLEKKINKIKRKSANISDKPRFQHFFPINNFFIKKFY